MLIKYWQDNELSPQIFKGAGNKNNIFVICPVRNATPEEKEKLNKIIDKHESKGYKVHYPERDTNQSPMVDGINTGGYSICLENARALADANTVVIFYNKESVGSMFDLGVTCYLQELYPNRNFIVENEFKYDKNNIIDRNIERLVKNQNKDELI